MNKRIAVLSAALLSAALVGCGGKAAEPKDDVSYSMDVTTDSSDANRITPKPGTFLIKRVVVTGEAGEIFASELVGELLKTGKFAADEKGEILQARLTWGSTYAHPLDQSRVNTCEFPNTLDARVINFVSKKVAISSTARANDHGGCFGTSRNETLSTLIADVVSRLVRDITTQVEVQNR